jgi:hypothetical protein
MSFLKLDSSYEKRCDICLSLNMISSSICVPEMTSFHSSLELNKTPQCMYTTFSLCIWVQSLGLVNTAATNMGVQVSLLRADLHPFRCPGVEDMHILNVFIHLLESAFPVICWARCFLWHWQDCLTLPLHITLINNDNRTILNVVIIFLPD